MAGRSPTQIVFRLTVRRDSDVTEARLRVRELGARYAFSPRAIEALAIATSEVVRNVVVHAGEGELLLGTVEEGARRGIVVVARDEGPGISNLEAAMQDGFSTAGSLGFGLPGARRLVHELDIQSGLEGGTTVVLTQWDDEPPR